MEAKATLRNLHQGQKAGEEDAIDREVENMDGGTDKGEDRKTVASWADVSFRELRETVAYGGGARGAARLP